MKTLYRYGAAVSAISLAVCLQTPAFAQGSWASHHPGRVADNARRMHEYRQISDERRNGQITRGQAQALRGNLHANYQEERADAAADHSHVTAGEQRLLQQQLSANEHDIHGALRSWDAHHPGRAYDNTRRVHQLNRINQEARDGTISQAQAHALRSDLHANFEEERADASVDHSHLTAADQKALNQQLNTTSYDIYHHPK